jgi:geranylgeranyl reductase family protein
MNCDVAVVGAGPAGAWAARALAEYGARVRLFDASHPREKPCGGGVTGRALRLVDGAIDRSLPVVAIRSARFTSSSTSRSADVHLRSNALAVASRTEFDRALVDAAIKAGAEPVAARVSDVRLVDGGVELDTSSGTHRASIVVGADGANSLVRRRLTTAFRRDQLSIATGFFAYGATSDEIVIEFVADPPGYIWSFPRPDHLAIGMCAQADAGASAADLRRVAAGWIARNLTIDHARLVPYSWPIPSLHAVDFQSLQPAGPRWFLVGDAAGLVDPITREGIYFALESAAWAAEAIASARGVPWESYAARVRAETGSELALAARVKQRFFRPSFTRLLIEALGRSRAVRAVMADLAAGEQPYSTLRPRLLKTLQIGLAARLFGLRARSPKEGIKSNEVVQSREP